MAVFIRIKDLSGKIQRVQVTNDRKLIGRSSKCDIKVKDPQVSGRHCYVFLYDGQVAIKDNSSTNGIIVNGSSFEETKITLKDKVQIGNTEITVDVRSMSDEEEERHSVESTELSYIDLPRLKERADRREKEKWEQKHAESERKKIEQFEDPSEVLKEKQQKMRAFLEKNNKLNKSEDTNASNIVTQFMKTLLNKFKKRN